MPHYSMEFLQTLFSKCSFAQDQLAVTPSSSNLEDTVRTVVAEACSQPMAKIQRTLSEHSKHNSIAKINTHQFKLNQRDKDKQFWVNTFANKMVQYHIGDLFDVQMKCQDIAKHARVLTLS